MPGRLRTLHTMHFKSCSLSICGRVAFNTLQALMACYMLIKWMVVPPTILCMSCSQWNTSAVKGSTMVHLAVGLHAKPFASRRIFLLHLSPFLTQHTCLVSLRMLCSMLCYLVQNRCISQTCVGTRHVLNHRLSSCNRCYSHFLENAFQLMWQTLLLLCCHMT